MKQQLKYFFSTIVCSFLTSWLAAQTPENQELTSWWQFNYDYGKSVALLLNDNVRQEAGIDYTFKKHIVLRFEAGNAKLKPKNAILNGTYQSKGSYFRIGPMYKIEPAPSRYLSIGATFGFSFFKDLGQVNILSEVYPDLNKIIDRSGLSARFVELAVSTEGPISKNARGFGRHLYWGATARIKYLVSETSVNELDIYAIPGFGTTRKSSSVAASLFIAYHFHEKLFNSKTN